MQGSLLLLFSIFLSIDGQASSSLRQHELLFGTKTAYNIAKGSLSKYLHGTSQLSQETLKSSSSPNIHPTQCKPKQFSLFLRHGTRYPSKGDTKKIAKLKEKLKFIGSNSKTDALKKWKNTFAAENASKLSQSGKEELRMIASRFAALLNDLLPNADAVELISSDKERTKSSALAFLDGIADGLPVNTKELSSRMEFRNDLMRFYEICSSYAYSEVNDYRRDQSMVEVTTFYSGPEALAVTKRVNSRLNISENENSFTTEEVRIMWVLCGFEKALLGPGYDSPWCHLLTTEDSQVLEYAQDLKAYWKKGYGYTINYEQSCPLLTDIFTNFQEIISNSSAPAVSLYFGHTETLLPFYSLLGLFLDEKPLTASNFLQHKEKRKFRSSIISPFAANIGFTLYECEEGAQASHPDWPQDLQSHMLQIMVNEQIMPLPFTDKVAVSISDFEYHYYQYVHYCNFNKLCNNSPANDHPAHEEL